MLETGLIGSRFVHFVAALSLLGAALFPLYIFRGQTQALAIDHPRLVRRIRWLMVGSALFSLLSGAGWFLFTAGTMAGDLSQAANPDVLSAMMRATDFGPVWLARFVLLLMIFFMLPRWPRRAAVWLVPILAALLAGSLSLTGHARANEGWTGVVHIGSDATHLIAAGIWLGGLWPLGFMIAALRRARDDSQNEMAIGDVLTRFSGIGTITVAVLVATGLLNSWLLVGTPDALVTSSYGRILSLKIVLFLLMAMLATANRFWLTPKLEASPSSKEWLARLRSHVIGEQVLGLLVLGVVSVLGTLEPATAQ